jgi:hypothetical protein
MPERGGAERGIALKAIEETGAQEHPDDCGVIGQPATARPRPTIGAGRLVG